MNYLMGTITIDPGWNTALAFWVGDNNPITHVIKEPTKRKKILVEPRRLKYMFRKFENILKVYDDELITVYIEGVELWAYNLKSMTAAKRGDLFALAYMVGGYMAICQKHGYEVKLLYPRGDKKKEKVAWKGQLGPDKLARRLLRLNGKTYPEHVREAVAMGFSVMGVL